MKKALLAAALMSAGVVAHAQSSVTLYGRLDAGLEYMSGVPSGANVNGAATTKNNRFRAESGVSDLYRLHLPDGKLEHLTDDRYQDLDPGPNADGTELVVA